MYKTHKISMFFLMVAFLVTAACGGAPSGTGNTTGSGSGTDTGAGSETDPVTETDSGIKIGYTSASGFVQDEIGASISTSLSAGGITELTVNFVDDDNDPVLASSEVSFTSGCVADGTSILSESLVTTINGQVSVDYTANGCVGEDEITATTSIDGVTLQAKLALIVESEEVGSIAFDAAIPENISLAGTGGNESSDITFIVKGGSGSPLIGQEVEFALNSSTGGLSLDETTAVSDNSGLVTATVLSGSVSTAVRVTATVVSSGISTQSSALSVSTGYPDQNSMSLALSTFNPPAWEYDGVEVTATVYLGDIYNNSVPDGTAVTFTTEGGRIDSGCTTVNSTCSVTWYSQNSRPIGNSGDVESRSGRVTILATAIGNESFADADANGLFDNTDTFYTDICTDRNVPVNNCNDMPEAFRDDNENGVRDSVPPEPYTDFNDNGEYDLKDGRYNGVLCSEVNNGDCVGVPKTLTVRYDQVLVMSSVDVLTDDNLIVGQPRLVDATTTIDDNDNGLYDPERIEGPDNPNDDFILIPEVGETLDASFTLFLADINGNSLPVDTTVTVTTDAQGSDFKVISTVAEIGASETEPADMRVTVNSTRQEDSVVKSAEIKILVVTPIPGGGENSSVYSSTFLYWGDE